MSNFHLPVLLDEIAQSFQEVSGGVKRYFDGTFGRGGHAKAFFSQFADLEAVVMDQDQQAIQYGKEEFASFKIDFIHSGFENFKEQLAPLKKSEDYFDIMLLDLGVSSPQLDQADRGFSFSKDGPLDMRMNQNQNVSAADVLNESDEDELIKIFQDLGEVRRPFRVVKAVVHDRKEKPFLSTREFAGLIERVDGWSKRGVHPATKYFMALRLKVNRELEQVENALPDLMKGLRPDGRLAVITFHSLEDRIVKNIFKNSPALGKPVNKKVIQPKWEEKKKNPRARSAKLRIFQRVNLEDAPVSKGEVE